MTGTTFTYLVIAEDGTSHEHRARLRTGGPDDLLRRTVGEWPQTLTLPDPDLYAWRDGDGGPAARQLNPVGSRLVAHLGGRPLPLVGPIVITGKRGSSTTSLTDTQVAALLAALVQCR
jgi:hypothetical protein